MWYIPHWRPHEQVQNAVLQAWFSIATQDWPASNFPAQDAWSNHSWSIRAVFPRSSPCFTTEEHRWQSIWFPTLIPQQKCVNSCCVFLNLFFKQFKLQQLIKYQKTPNFVDDFSQKLSEMTQQSDILKTSPVTRIHIHVTKKNKSASHVMVQGILTIKWATWIA